MSFDRERHKLNPGLERKVVGMKMVHNIFLVAGQSNTDGRVMSSDRNAPSYLNDNIVNNVRVWNGNTIDNYDLRRIGKNGNGSSWVLPQSSAKYSFAHVALKNIADLLPNVLVCQVTSGGTPLAAVSNPRGSWYHKYDAIPKDTPRLLQDLQHRYESLISWLNTRGVEYRVSALLWHQGEWDDDEQFDKEDEYFDNFVKLIRRVRQFTGSRELPVLYGTVDAESKAQSPIIRDAHLKVVETDRYAYCRNNDDLSLFDDFHFDARSCNTFGNWISNKYFEIT